MYSSRLYSDVFGATITPTSTKTGSATPATASTATAWLQMYLFAERDLVAASVQKAAATGHFSALVGDHPHSRVPNRMVPNFSTLAATCWYDSSNKSNGGSKSSSGGGGAPTTTTSSNTANDYNAQYVFPNQAAMGGSTYTKGDMRRGVMTLESSGTNQSIRSHVGRCRMDQIARTRHALD
jgi:hypothetical protein